MAKLHVRTASWEVGAEADTPAALDEVLGNLARLKLLPASADVKLSPDSPGSSGNKPGGLLAGPFDTIGGPMLGAAATPPQSTEIASVFRGDALTGDLRIAVKLQPNSKGDRLPDATLVLLRGYENVGIKPVRASALLDSLKKTGYNIPRIDRPLGEYTRDGLIMPSGAKGGRTYELSEPGRRKADGLVQELINLLHGQVDTA